MGLFDKKYCDICGGQIGLLGNRKLKDGNCCKDCAAKLSVWFTGRKASTVQDIKNQLAYRTENQKKVLNFVATKEFEGQYKLLVDTSKGQFLVTRSSNWRNANPDVLNINDVLAVECEIKEDKDEVFDKDAEGNKVSFEPQKFEYEYDFRMTIRVNNPYFDEIEYELTTTSPDSPFSDLYKEYVERANQIATALRKGECVIKENNTYIGEDGVSDGATITILEGEWLCPECNTKNAENFCCNCGTKKPSAQPVIKFCPQCGYKVPEGTVTKFCPQCGKQLG